MTAIHSETMAEHPDVVRATEAPQVQIIDFSARLLMEARHTAAVASMVEHGIGPRSLAAPLHTHANEDEYTYVIEGTLGFEVGGRTFTASAGDVVFKPRGVPHAMWNSTDEAARMLELIVPGGFESYFGELAQIMPPQTEAPDVPALEELAARYGLDMDISSIGRLSADHGLGAPGR